MKLVVIESPYAAETGQGIFRNVVYARRCIRDSLDRGEAPYASHILYPGALRDSVPAERERALAACHAWIARADLVAVYTDKGISPGMELAIEVAEKTGIPVEKRRI